MVRCTLRQHTSNNRIFVQMDAILVNYLSFTFIIYQANPVRSRLYISQDSISICSILLFTLLISSSVQLSSSK